MGQFFFSEINGKLGVGSKGGLSKGHNFSVFLLLDPFPNIFKTMSCICQNSSVGRRSPSTEERGGGGVLCSNKCGNDGFQLTTKVILAPFRLFQAIAGAF